MMQGKGKLHPFELTLSLLVLDFNFFAYYRSHQHTLLYSLVFYTASIPV